MTTSISQSHDSVLALASIPSPPPDRTREHLPRAAYRHGRGILPAEAELAVLSNAIYELARCSDFADIFGRSVGAFPRVLSTFERAAHWTAMRAKLAVFEEYCRAEERLAWSDLRTLMAAMRPVFNVVVKSHSDLAVRFFHLGEFFRVPKDVARRGADTRQAKSVQRTIAKATAKAARAPSSPDQEDDDDSL